MHPLLKRLTELVPPPDEPLVLTSHHESITGLDLELPDDYLEFMEVYGPGKFCAPPCGGFLFCDTIMGCLGDVSLPKFMYTGNQPEYEKFFKRQYPNADKVPLFFSWGSDDRGVKYGWIAAGKPNDWLAASEGEVDIHTENTSMLALLLQLFEKGLPDDEDGGYCNLPEYWPVTYERF